MDTGSLLALARVAAPPVRASLVRLLVLRRGVPVPRHHARVRGAGIDRVAGAHRLDPEAPLVAVVEEEEELLAPARPGPRHVAEPDPARRPCAPPEQRVRLTLERVL